MKGASHSYTTLKHPANPDDSEQPHRGMSASRRGLRATCHGSAPPVTSLSRDQFKVFDLRAVNAGDHRLRI
jgi:hypothetical protein